MGDIFGLPDVAKVGGWRWKIEDRLWSKALGLVTRGGRKLKRVCRAQLGAHMCLSFLV